MIPEEVFSTNASIINALMKWIEFFFKSFYVQNTTVVGEGMVRTPMLIYGQRLKCPFLKTDSLADTYFLTKKVFSGEKKFFTPINKNFGFLKININFSFFWKKNVFFGNIFSKKFWKKHF